MDLDIYYRALTDLRRHTKEDRDCEARRKSISSADTANDNIEVIKTNCIIEEDWIDAIEKGLVHVGKALGEERQFIRSNGEVIPIEKVKQVSKDSVEHLARHSNLLTRKPEEGRNIIPDQLYTVERLSDFAVYENRFLYMLLCFLRDFIAFRYEKIVELTNTYNGKLEMRKNVHQGGRTTVCELKLDEEIKNDAFLKEHNPAKDKIERIDLILKTVIAYLNTPLMEFVAKAPMLKPPITETNVLRMNKNFKGAKELYYFVSSYSKLGYTIERKTETINPFPDEIADEFAEMVALNAFLAYMHGLGIEKELKANFDKYEKELKEIEKKKRDEQLKSLKKRIKQSGKTDEEYILLLEQRNKALEGESIQLAAAKEEAIKLNGEITSLNNSVAALNEKIEALTEEYSAELKKKSDEHAEEMSAKVARFNEELNRVTSEFNEKIASQRAECENILFTAELEKAEKQNEYNELLYEVDKLVDEKRLIQARLNAVMHKNGMLKTENFSSQESFDEIEEQYKAFKAFFKDEWRIAKKQIRKDVLNSENIKNLSEKRYDYEVPKADLDMNSVFGKKPKKRRKRAEKTEEPDGAQYRKMIENKEE